MSSAAACRQLMTELGIDDDRQERALIDLLQEKDAALALERLRVSDRELELENRLMKMEAKNVTS